MEFRNQSVPEMEEDFITAQLSTPPVINIIDKTEFNKRIDIVFRQLHDALSKSFGPGGAGTFISIYPKYFNTKDGFTIMKNIAFDKKLDQIICDMMMDICSRLNFTVGDGTTTAVLATHAIYEAYREQDKEYAFKRYLPREIIGKLEVIKDDIIKELDARATSIRSDDVDEMVENIRRVVHVSSNGNTELTNIICDLYRQLQYPAISVTKSKDGIMKSSVIEGYTLNAILTDKIYINNDDNTMNLNGADIVIFDHKVTQDTYQNLLIPMVTASHQRNRKLVCIAPFYDEVALSGKIRNDLMTEFNKTGTISLVLVACKAVRGDDKIRLDDLAMLLKTRLITSYAENDMIERLKNMPPHMVFNFDNRNIPGVLCAYQTDENNAVLRPYTENGGKPMGYDYAAETFPIGYCGNIKLGLKDSSFAEFYYDQKTYDTYMSIAKEELADVKRRVEVNGTFSAELLRKQERVFHLGLKTGVIEVGASSEISQNYLKDMVDDAVKAAASAYHNGVVLGCNVTTCNIIRDLRERYPMMIDDTNDLALYEDLLNILYLGFCYVGRTVLMNVFQSDIDTYTITSNDNIFFSARDVEVLNEFLADTTLYNAKFTYDQLSKVNKSHSLVDTLVRASHRNNAVIDVGNHGVLSKDVINSAETDKEITKAIVDLLSLLITGNQIVIR